MTLTSSQIPCKCVHLSFSSGSYTHLSVCLSRLVCGCVCVCSLYEILRFAKCDFQTVNSAHKSKSIWNPDDSAATTRTICLYNLRLTENHSNDCLHCSLSIFISISFDHSLVWCVLCACVLSVATLNRIAFAGNYNAPDYIRFRFWFKMTTFIVNI